MVHVDRARLEVDPNCVKRSLDAIVALQADHHQVVCSAVLGHKADIMIMAVGPDLARLGASVRLLQNLQLVRGRILPPLRLLRHLDSLVVVRYLRHRFHVACLRRPLH